MEIEMRFFSRKFFLVAVAAILPLNVFAHDHTVETQTVALEKALTLDNCGILKQKENGYLYLQVTDEFITEILPLIECEGKIFPPRFTKQNGIGAHVSVMFEGERFKNQIWDVEELGQAFCFYVKELRTVKVCHHGKVRKLWVLVVDAPELEQLRASYGLPNKIKKREFHITIGFQRPNAHTSHAGAEFCVGCEEVEEEVLEPAA